GPVFTRTIPMRTESFVTPRTSADWLQTATPRHINIQANSKNPARHFLFILYSFRYAVKESSICERPVFETGLDSRPDTAETCRFYNKKNDYQQTKNRN